MNVSYLMASPLFMQFFGTTLLAFVFSFVFSSAGVAGDLPLELGRDLNSIRIVEIDEDGARVSYLPGKILLTDPNGSGKSFQAMKAGSHLLLSAHAGIVAVDEDVTELQRRATARLGSAAQVIAVRPEAFLLEIEVGGRQALRRPLAGGPLTEIPVQVMVPSGPASSPIPVHARAELTWTREIGARHRSRTLVTTDDGATATFGLSTDGVAIGISQTHRQETVRESSDHRRHGGDTVTLVATFSFIP